MYDGIYKHSILHTYFITNDAFFHTCVLLRTLAVYDAFRHYVRCTMMSCLSIGFMYIIRVQDSIFNTYIKSLYMFNNISTLSTCISFRDLGCKSQVRSFLYLA